MTASLNDLLGFAGVVVGAGISLLGVRLQALSSSNQSTLDRQSRQLDRHEERQYQWLIGVQDCLADWVKGVVDTYLAHVKNHDEHPDVNFGAMPIPDEDFQREAELSRRVEIYNSRIDEEQIRELVSGLLAMKVRITRPSDLQLATRAVEEMFARNNEAVQVIGAKIRSVDRGGLPESSRKGK